MRNKIVNTVRAFISIWIVFSLTACSSAFFGRAQDAPVAPAAKDSILRVTVTSQIYNFHRPWQQRRPSTREAIGVVVPDGRVLVTAVVVSDHRFIELETLDDHKKTRAEVEVVDYEANLALLKPSNPDFLKHHRSMQLAERVGSQDQLAVWQVKANGEVVPSTARITSIELSAFSQGNHFLVYRLNGTLQFRFNNLTLPVIKGDGLAGLLLRNASSEQTIDVVAAPVIAHFLKDARNGEYQGFPSAGFGFGATLDPQLRSYIGLADDISGIYVQSVLKGSPADRAGLQTSDVITHVNDIAISNSGQYVHPIYGKTSIAHLIRTGFYVDDTVQLKVFRKGRPLTLSAVLDHRKPDGYLVPPFIIDQPPTYLVFGGLVIQELSMSYLREYGSDWVSRAPIHLLYYNQNQDYFGEDTRKKIVIISSVIPTPYSIGFENLADLVISRINNREIQNLADVSAALAEPQNGFHKIEVEQHPKTIYLDPKEIPLIHQMIEQRYRIPAGLPDPVKKG
jgi:S1-C subfamily serine protease